MGYPTDPDFHPPTRAASYDTDEMNHALAQVKDELLHAVMTHATFNTPHEGYAVILEELDELWDEVRRRHQDRDAMRKEAMQIAAMALRFMVDLCPGKFRG
jgi:hypothetical protein